MSGSCSDQEAGRSTPKPRIRRSSTIYLEDANMALVTEDNVAFCVHRSILRRLSAVFANMLEVCNVPGNSIQTLDVPETFETLPVVRISDSSSVLADFFQIIYDQKPELSSFDYERLAALMVFCHKYMIDAVFDKIVSLLRCTFPDKLSNWERPVQEEDIEYVHPEGAIHIILAITTTNVRMLLPSCLYSVVSNSGLKLHLHRFPQPLLVQYLQGFSKLSVYHIDFYANILVDLDTPSMTCDSSGCRRHWDDFKDVAKGYFEGRGWITDPDPLLILRQLHTHVRSNNEYCSGCSKAIERLFTTAQNKLWSSLPQIFGIADNWEEIRKEAGHEG